MSMTTLQASHSNIKGSDLTAALSALRTHGLALIPTDTVWSVACDATDDIAVERLCRLTQPTTLRPVELLFASLGQLLQYIHRFHPKLETLLAYHLRPLTVISPGGRQLSPLAMTSNQRFAVRITRDAYCLQLIEKLQKPLATMAASTNPEVPAPAGFGFIRSDIIEQVNYVARHRHRDPATDSLSVMIELDAYEEINFLRE